MSTYPVAEQPRIAGVAGALPQHRYRQEDITQAILDNQVSGSSSTNALLRRFHEAANVETRYLTLPMDAYLDLGFGAANDAYLTHAVDLGETAIRKALAATGVQADQVDQIMVVSTTGIATPSLDARLIPRLGLRHDVKRMPLFGLGCVAGVAGIARLRDYLIGHPDEIAVLLAVELPSLFLQLDDVSIANLVASGLFGDGAAAVVMTGATRAASMGITGPAVLGSASRWYADSDRVMAWDITDQGFTIALDARVPELVDTYLREEVDGFLGRHGLTITNIGAWIAHPGGPKVLDAMARALDQPATAFDNSWRCLADMGNISSATVLHVLARTLETADVEPGTTGVMTALGPGFCSELALLRF